MCSRVCSEELNKLKRVVETHEEIKDKLILSLETLQEIVTDFNGNNKEIFSFVRDKNLKRRKSTK